MNTEPDYEFSLAFLEAAQTKFTRDLNDAHTQKNQSAIRSAFNAKALISEIRELVKASTPASRGTPMDPNELIGIDPETLASITADTIPDQNEATMALMTLARFSNQFSTPR